MAGIHIVKRKGHLEKFDERKVYLSCIYACRSSHMGEKETEKVCRSVMKSVKTWIRGKKRVTSQQIFAVIRGGLRKHSEDAAFMYETHKDLF